MMSNRRSREQKLMRTGDRGSTPTTALQKEKNLSGFAFPGEAQLLAELKESEAVRDKSDSKVSYVMRLKYSLLVGRFSFCLPLWSSPLAGLKKPRRRARSSLFCGI